VNKLTPKQKSEQFIGAWFTGTPDEAAAATAALTEVLTTRSLEVPRDFRCADCGKLITNHVVVSRCETKGCEEHYTGPPFGTV